MTHNGDASDPSTITWHRIDNPSSPTRYVSGIYPDPANPACVDLVLGLQRGYSDDAGSRIRGDRTGRAWHGHVHQPERGKRHVRLPDAHLYRRPAGVGHRPATHPHAVRGHGLLVFCRLNDGQSGWHTMKVHASLRDHAPRDPAVQPVRPDLHGRRATASACSDAATHSQGICKLDLGPGKDDDN